MSWSVYERFQYKALTDNIFGVWEGGRLRELEVVAYGMWSHVKVRLYLQSPDRF